MDDEFEETTNIVRDSRLHPNIHRVENTFRTIKEIQSQGRGLRKSKNVKVINLDDYR